MHRLSGMYHPITGTPFQSDETYMEWAPCNALKPYIRCFWGTKQPVHGGKKEGQQGIVIPDTCMDVIFDITRKPLIYFAYAYTNTAFAPLNGLISQTAEPFFTDLPSVLYTQRHSRKVDFVLTSASA